MEKGFIKYQHLERWGTTEVDGINFGSCYVFPKIDGANASVWKSNGKLQFGSRKRHLTIDNDNQGFMEWGISNNSLVSYFDEFPDHRLFGEWLVPHSLKTYRDDAWRNFYVFDVCLDKSESEIRHEGDSKLKYLHYEEYKVGLEKHGIDFIPPICTTTNVSYDQLVKQLVHNVFLIEDGNGTGEGIVIKNYSFENTYGRQTWAKIVTSEFKEKHAKKMGGHVVKGKKMVEEEIADKYVTKSLCEKVLSKIKNNGGFTSKQIPQLLNTVYYDVVKEDCWNFVKEFKKPKIDFGTLQHFVFQKTKENLPEIF